MDIEEPFGRIQKRVDRVEKSDNLIEQAILQMKDLVISHEEKTGRFFKIDEGITRGF